MPETRHPEAVRICALPKKPASTSIHLRALWAGEEIPQSETIYLTHAAHMG